MKIGILYDQGTAPYREDGLVVEGRLFGVLDGVSAPYAPKYPPKLFNGLSGGEMVARFCERFAALTISVKNLHQFVLEMNGAVSEEQEETTLDDAGELAGASFAFAHLTEDHIAIAQAGDCMAVIELRSGEVVVTPNQVRRHDTVMNAEIERLQREVAQELSGLSLEKVPKENRGQVRDEMWNRFYHTFREARRQDANNPDSPRGYGILNGQPALKLMLWERSFGREEVATILLFSDGIMPWTVMKSMDDEKIGRAVLAELKHRGLAGLLLSARGVEEQTIATAYLDYAEATAMAIQF